MVGMGVTFVGILTVLGFAVMLPVVTLGVYCARRWVGVEPFPLLARLLRQGSNVPSRMALVPGVAAFVGVALAAVSVGMIYIYMAIIGRDPASVEDPFDFTGAQFLVFNLQIVAEEAVFRAGLMFVLLAAFRVRGAHRVGRPSWRMWMAFVVSGLVFASAHGALGAAFEFDAFSWLLFSLVQKGLLVGTFFGYVAWRWGVESAVLAHYAFNVFAMLPLALFG